MLNVYLALLFIITKNGKLLEKVVTENDLVIVNAQDLCKGVITRYRKTVNSEEKIVLDYFIVCKRFYNLVMQPSSSDKKSLIKESKSNNPQQSSKKYD